MENSEIKEIKQTTLDKTTGSVATLTEQKGDKINSIPSSKNITKAIKRRMLSPSQINVFRQCPRKWYYSYIEKLPSVPSIHLIRGSAVHAAIEEISKLKALPNKSWKARLRKVAIDKLDDRWVAVGKLKKLTDEEKQKFYDESVMMIDAYLHNLYYRIDISLLNGKTKSPTHAWHWIKPKFTELALKDDVVGVRGYIDEVHKDFSGQTYILDLKTSSKYRIQMSEDYKLQLAIYAHLYQNDTGQMPSYVAIQYLKYNETYFVPVTKHLIDWAKTQIETMRFFIEKWDKDKCKYYKTESKLCGWCDYYDKCKVD